MDKTTRRRLGRSQASNEQKIRREIAIMKKCIHPHVVRLIEVIDDPTARKIYLGKVIDLWLNWAGILEKSPCVKQG